MQDKDGHWIEVPVVDGRLFINSKCADRIKLDPTFCPCCKWGQHDGDGGCVCVEGCPNA